MRRAVSLIFSNLVAKSKTLSRNAPKSFPSPRPFPKCPFRYLQTLSQNTPAHPSPAPASLPSRQRKLRELSELEEAFEDATNTDEILSAFEVLEPSLAPDDQKLGLACLKVGQHLESISFADHQKTLEFALRALSILDRDSKPSISVAMSLHLLGAVHYTLKRFNDSLGFLNRANRILTALEKEGTCDFDIRSVVHAVQLQLANTKTAMGRREEALVNLRRCLDLKVAILEPDSRELGAAHRDLAEAHASVLNFKDALPLCLKALEIHEKQLGPNSVDVAHDRRLLGVIYTGLEEHEKALEVNEKAQKVLKSWGMGPDLLNAEIDQANIQIALGKFDEAIKTLKGVVEQTEKNSETRALVFVSMAKAMCCQEKFADSKRCLEISCEILKERESISPEMVAESYTEISSLYESMNEFATSISLLKRALSMLERLPQEQHLEGNVSAKIGWLLLLTGKVELAVPYLESAAERLKESFGPKHFGVGYIYNNLGAAYLEMDRPQSAAQMFALAKDIMDVSLGPHHADSIEACQSLANAYSTMGSYVLALEFQQRVVDAWGSYGPNGTDELREAERRLDELKKKACGSLSDMVLRKALPQESDTLHTGSSQH